MIDIKEINVSCMYGVHRLLVTFKTTDSAEDFARYRFDVLRSNAQDGKYVLCGSNITNMEFVDNFVDLLDISIQYYYKVKITDLIEGISKISETVGALEKHEPDKWSSAIAEIEERYLKRVICNDKIYWLKQKTCGQICDCYDDIREDAAPDCPECFGTKFVGGYYPAQEIEVNYQTGISFNEHMDQRGITEQMPPISFWAQALPRIQVRDIIAGQNGWRYIVTNVMPTHKNHYILRQIVSAQWLPKSDLRYTIPIKGVNV